MNPVNRLRRNAQTIRLPYWIYDSGIFRGRKSSTMFQVFVAYLRFADWTTGNGRLSRRTLSTITGIKDRETLSRSTTMLRRIGLVKTWWRKTDLGWVYYYQVALTVETMRTNAATYLKRKSQKRSRRYVAGFVHKNLTEKSATYQALSEQAITPMSHTVSKILESLPDGSSLCTDSKLV